MNTQYFYKYWYLFLFLFCLVLFSPMFFRPFLGADAYAFLTFVFHGRLGVLLGPEPIPFLFSFIPASFILIKFMLFSMFFLTAAIVSRLGFLFNGEKGLLSGFFLVSTSPLWLIFCANFENDVFGFFFALLGILLLAEYYFDKNKSLAYPFLGSLFCLISVLVWRGILLFFFAIGFSFVFVAPFMLLLYFFFHKEVLSSLVLNRGVAEAAPFTGLFMSFFLLLGVFGLPPLLLSPTILLLFFGALSVKWSYLALPFLSIGLSSLFKKNSMFSQLPLYAIVFGLFFAFLVPTFIAPSQGQLDIIDEVILVVGDENVEVDWSFGYWFEFLGKPVDNKGGLRPTRELPGYIFSVEDFNCPVIRDYNSVKLFYC